MGLRTTEEVINGEAVTRFNGNNSYTPGRVRQGATPKPRDKKGRITAWRKHKAAQEALYERTYLNG